MTPEQWVALAAFAIGASLLIWAHFREKSAEVDRHIRQTLALIDEDRQAQGLEANTRADWY